MQPHTIQPATYNPSARYTSALLYFISAYAFYAVWGLSFSDSTMSRILTIRDQSIPLIPNTTVPLRLRFTGIAPVDYWLTIMVLFFWEAVDGSHPATSVVGIYFLGQLLGVWTIVWVVGSRTSGIGRTTLWMLLMQNLTLGCFGPVWCALHLGADHLKQASSSRRMSEAARQIQHLPMSMILGYVVPSVLIGLPAPGLASYTSQQAAIAIWTPFPIWVGLAQVVFIWLDAQLSTSRLFARGRCTEDPTTYTKALRSVYIFAIGGCAVVNIGTVVVCLSTVLFPALFASRIQFELAPLNLLRYPAKKAATSIGEGVLGFMQKDQWLGYGAFWIWLLQLERTDGESKPQSWFRLVLGWLEIIFTIVLLGPGGAAVLFFWMRDEGRLAR